MNVNIFSVLESLFGGIIKIVIGGIQQQFPLPPILGIICGLSCLYLLCFLVVRGIKLIGCVIKLFRRQTMQTIRPCIGLVFFLMCSMPSQTVGRLFRDRIGYLYVVPDKRSLYLLFALRLSGALPCRVRHGILKCIQIKTSRGQRAEMRDES